MQPFAKQDWEGDDKIVIAIDVGTTHSAVSYAHLYAGSITSFPRTFLPLLFLTKSLLQVARKCSRESGSGPVCLIRE